MITKLPPLQLYYGKESFLMEEACEQLKEQIPVEERDWNLLTLDLEETPLTTVLQEAETPSFFGGKRLIFAKNATFFTTAKAKREPNHDLDQLRSYITKPSETSLLIFTVATEKLDKRKKIVKEMEKNAVVKKFDSLKGQALLKWVVNRLAAYQVEISRDDCITFIQLAGPNLRLLDQECRKLAIYVGKQRTITAEAIHALIPRSLEDNVFQLTEKIAEKKLAEVWQIWGDLLAKKEEPIGILALITRQFRLLYQTKLLINRGLSTGEIAKQLGVHPYPVKLAAAQSAAFSDQRLRKLLTMAIAAEQDIKTGKIDKIVAVEQILLAI